MNKLKTPPLTRVTLAIYFDNNLKIFENKSVFFEQIKKDFPEIIYPENKHLKYPMGDVSFLSSQYDRLIEINSNRFTFSDFKYQDFNTFFSSVKEYIMLFNKTYNLNQFTTFNFTYENIIRIKKEIGEKFSDYFTIDFNFKGKKEKTFLATQGSFAFNVKEGILSVDIAPENFDKKVTEKYKFSITFMSTLSSKANLEKLLNSVTAAHEFIDDIFESSLAENYLKTLTE